jgi:hypothetical protein
MTDKRLVIVEWTDAACDASWQNEGTILTPSKVYTAGWLLHEDAEHIMVAGTIAQSGDFNQTMTIPASMVTSMKDV